jgi:hypothetical protein
MGQKGVVMESKKIYGLLAEFDGPAALVKAAETCRDAGFKEFDCHAPFPIHGLEKSMGLKKSALGWIVLVCGISGLLTGLGLQWWSHSVAYPLIIAGKPLFALPAYIPICFELTILFSAFGAVFGMFGLNRLPTFYHQLFNSRHFKRASDDGFFLSMEAQDPKFEMEPCKKLLQSVGALQIEVIE